MINNDKPCAKASRWIMAWCCLRFRSTGIADDGWYCWIKGHCYDHWSTRFVIGSGGKFSSINRIEPGQPSLMDSNACLMFLPCFKRFICTWLSTFCWDGQLYQAAKNQAGSMAFVFNVLTTPGPCHIWKTSRCRSHRWARDEGWPTFPTCQRPGQLVTVFMFFSWQVTVGKSENRVGCPQFQLKYQDFPDENGHFGVSFSHEEMWVAVWHLQENTPWETTTRRRRRTTTTKRRTRRTTRRTTTTSAAAVAATATAMNTTATTTHLVVGCGWCLCFWLFLVIRPRQSLCFLGKPTGSLVATSRFSLSFWDPGWAKASGNLGPESGAIRGPRVESRDVQGGYISYYIHIYLFA